jgi:hypothetical protein
VEGGARGRNYNLRSSLPCIEPQGQFYGSTLPVGPVEALWVGAAVSSQLSIISANASQRHRPGRGKSTTSFPSMRARTLARSAEGAHSQAPSQYSVPGTLHAAGATVTTGTDARALEEICGRRQQVERCASRGDNHDLLESIDTVDTYRRTRLSLLY